MVRGDLLWRHGFGDLAEYGMTETGDFENHQQLL
jgi:hypothetical protein